MASDGYTAIPTHARGVRGFGLRLLPLVAGRFVITSGP